MSKSIHIERFYPHPIEAVWKAIANAEALKAWLMPNDFKLGKDHEFTFRTQSRPGFDGIVKCRVVDFEAPNWLQYTWQGGPMKKPTMVTFRLTAVKGGTVLKFSHEGFEGLINEYVVRFVLGSGWKSLLKKKIKKYLDQ